MALPAPMSKAVAAGAAVVHRRRLRCRWGRVATLALGMTLCLAASPESHAADPGPGGQVSHGHQSRPHATWTSKDAAAYWTPQRMADAAPPEGDSQQSDASPQIAPTARHFDGIPSVGVLFSVDGEAREHHCTASVVHSPHGNLLLTAGHCNPGARAAFVPQYQSGADSQPYGVWAIEDTFAYSDRGTSGAGADLDFAFATVAPDDNGRMIESVTSGNVLTETPGYRNQVSVIGYPSAHSDPADRAVRCDARTSRLSGTRELRLDCGGFFGGTSGSPWLANFDEHTRTGRLIGVIGGVNGGGPSGPHNDRVSYSPYFGKEIRSLYNRAVKESAQSEQSAQKAQRAQSTPGQHSGQSQQSAHGGPGTDNAQGSSNTDNAQNSPSTDSAQNSPSTDSAQNSPNADNAQGSPSTDSAQNVPSTDDSQGSPSADGSQSGSSGPNAQGSDGGGGLL
ncbi:hypothetical protein GCM10010211_23170 [Streptomyces albospinus]|uniref:V8-like Glu-specific endopeptidase n=1 Tax=Streptomyces albospinus TaxID=285515 RepID=A0ABQ2UZM7_9ACTN|nr:hypothetical protein [Streptomyces albospinus]GGU57682.1 hypothetical protein GCM10010211_23170 [Streptomyces albospinus]